MSFYLLCFVCNCSTSMELEGILFFCFMFCFLSCAHPNKSKRMEAELLFNLCHSLTCNQILFSLWCWIIDPFFFFNRFPIAALNNTQYNLGQSSISYQKHTFAPEKVQSKQTQRHWPSLCPITETILVYFSGCAPPRLSVNNPIRNQRIPCWAPNCFDYV